MAAHDIWRSYQTAIFDTRHELATQARVIAGQTARSLQAVDLVLRHISDPRRAAAIVALSPRELHNQLKDLGVGLVQVEGLSVLDAGGSVQARSNLFPVRDDALKGLGFAAFQTLRTDRSQGLIVDHATRSVLTPERWVIPIVRRRETPAGAFTGVVVADGRVEYFQQVFRDQSLAEGTTIMLMHRNGTLLARYPPVEPTRVRPEPSRSFGPVDGAERLGAVELIPDYSLTISVTRDARGALALWRQQALGTAVRTLALATLAASLLALFHARLRSSMRRNFARPDKSRAAPGGSTDRAAFAATGPEHELSDINAYQQVEAALRKSEKRYELAMTGSSEGHWVWDMKSDETYVSARMNEILGLPPQALQSSYAEYVERVPIHPQDRERVRLARDEHLAGKSSRVDVEYRIIVPGTDKIRWIRARGQCFRDEHGNPVQLAGSIEDISERRCIEDALRQSEERYALAVAGSNDGILDWDIALDHMYVSERTMQLIGVARDTRVRTRGELNALAIPRFHPDDARRLNEELRKTWHDPSDSHEGEYRVRGTDGEYRWLRFRGRTVRSATGRAIRWAGSVSDIDAVKKTEEALRRSEERYQLAVAGSNEGLWDWDLASDSLFLSTRAQELLWLQSGAPQRPRREWIAIIPYHPDDLLELRSALAAHLHGTTQHFKVEYRVRHHSGAWHWYRQRGVAVRDPQGQPKRMAGSMEDITDRKNTEAHRERLEGQLRQAQKLEAIGTLAGGIAHDFNNILAAILGYGEMAQKGAAEGTALRRHIDAVLSAGMRAKALVERILAFSRSGPAARVPVHVQSVVTEALDLLTASLPPGIALERHLDAGDAAVLGDPTQVHQVVMNLCVNAVQAMQSQGTLTVTLDLSGPGRVTQDSAAPDHIRLRVRDTGPGMGRQVIERIFDPFFTTKDVGVGTGLGLSLVHGIVIDLGGSIDVDSRVGIGSTFTVCLPWQSNAPAPALVRESTAPNGRGQTILLVDDDEPLVRLGEEMIAELGYEPVAFTSSTKALEAFRADPLRFDAVLSDESMPGMTGSEMAVEIRLIRPGVPIVLMSGNVSAGLVARAQEAGVAEVLSKPLAAGDMARCLANALCP